MVEDKKVRPQAGGEVVVDASLLSTQKVRHDGVSCLSVDEGAADEAGVYGGINVLVLGRRHASTVRNIERVGTLAADDVPKRGCSIVGKRCIQTSHQQQNTVARVNYCRCYCRYYAFL